MCICVFVCLCTCICIYKDILHIRPTLTIISYHEELAFILLLTTQQTLMLHTHTLYIHTHAYICMYTLVYFHFTALLCHKCVKCLQYGRKNSVATTTRACQQHCHLLADSKKPLYSALITCQLCASLHSLRCKRLHCCRYTRNTALYNASNLHIVCIVS